MSNIQPDEMYTLQLTGTQLRLLGIFIAAQKDVMNMNLERFAHDPEALAIIKKDMVSVQALETKLDFIFGDVY